MNHLYQLRKNCMHVAINRNFLFQNFLYLFRYFFFTKSFQYYRYTKVVTKCFLSKRYIFEREQQSKLRYHFLPLLSPRLLDEVFVLLLLEDISTSSPFEVIFLCLDLLLWDSGRSSKSCWSCLSGTSRCFLLLFDPDETEEDPFWFDDSESCLWKKRD